MQQQNCSSSLFERTLELARNAPRSIKQKDMAAACGMSDTWISRLLKDDVPDPSVHAIQKLHDFLVSAA